MSVDYGTTAHGAKRPLHTQTAWNQARGGSAWPLTVRSGDINATVACVNIGAFVAAAFIPAEKGVGDHCDVIPNPSAAASQNVSLYCRTRWNVGPRGIRTQVPNHSKRCYAASWGIARSTNRKNRALRVHATTDNSSSQGYIRRGRTTPGKPRLRRGRTGTIEVVRSQNCRLFSAMRDSNWVRDAGVAGSNPATPTIYFCHSFFRAFSDCWRFPSQPRIPCLKRNINMRSRGAIGVRGLPVSPSIRGGCRECRVLAAPAVSCAMCVRKAHRSIQVQPEHSGIPCAMV
jgi:hypothetical protein